jgi:pilus assembly protein TadC
MDRFDPENTGKFILGVIVNMLVVAVIIGVFYWGTQGGFTISKVSIFIVLALGVLTFLLANYAVYRIKK